MQLPQAFNAQQYDPTQGAGGLPIGKHAVIIESSEVKATKDNTGGYIQLNLKITEGPQTGSGGAYRLNIYSANAQAVEIANKQLSAVCHVTGVFNVQDSQQLHNIPFMVEVGPQKNKPEYTEVKKVFDAAGNEPGKAAQPAAPAPAAATPGAPAAWGNSAPAPAAEAPATPATPATPANAPAWGAPPAAAPAAAPGTPPAPAAPAGGQPVPWGAPRG